MAEFVVIIPDLRVNTPGNSRTHWRVEAKRAKQERLLANLACSQLGSKVKKQLLAAKKLKVTFVRVGMRKLDRTNCVGAMKHCQDGMCDWLGIPDSSDWYEWEWPIQERGDDAVRIILEPIE